MSVRSIKNILEVQLSILLESEREFNFLSKFHEVKKDIDNLYPFEKLKEIFDRNLILNLYYLFDPSGKFSLEKLYCIRFNKKIFDASKSKLEDNLSSRISKLIKSEVVKEIKSVRDKYIAHKDITLEKKSISLDSLKTLLDESRTIHSLFDEESVVKPKNNQFHGTLFNSIIENTIQLQRIENENISKILKND